MATAQRELCQRSRSHNPKATHVNDQQPQPKKKRSDYNDNNRVLLVVLQGVHLLVNKQPYGQTQCCLETHTHTNLNPVTLPTTHWLQQVASWTHKWPQLLAGGYQPERGPRLHERLVQSVPTCPTLMCRSLMEQLPHPRQTLVVGRLARHGTAGFNRRK